ncbi:MAG: 2OG-Fe(II) oxygenase [Gammaproteobacteria bacterium]|jgi:PKHD-type hydroxylase|nr:2OG-Fe(II) oxygenase [Gammaproteobacteria bacterium]MDH3751167.1 2OG-Fe(II) oxygenase [Gammaproteobacteria bacterium]MDH3805829.1 2OG-Fe(II) oxygenase [Gammaproteobacteria bacterium]
MTAGFVREFPNARPMVENVYLSLIAYLPKHFSAEECHKIVGLANAEEKSEGQIGRGQDLQIRDSKVSYIKVGDESAWIYEKLEQILFDLNKEYKFELNGFHEGLQIAEYTSPGGHYTWHNDLGAGIFSARKLSMSVQLSDTGDYEGGELEFMDSSAPAPKEIGSLIVFPSYLQHRVKPVASGLRRSLVCWASGPAFK